MKTEKKPTSIVEVKKELNTLIGDKETLAQLVKTTFNGLSVDVAKEAMMEAMMRGFKFDDFLKKNVYAVPFKGGYSLVTSIDYARRIGMRSGVVGVDEPKYEHSEDGSTIISCAVTVKKIFEGGHIGDFTARVYFSEYSTGQNLWKSKPLTMIAKVAEMHALRKACPEELSQAYDESEIEREHSATAAPAKFEDAVDEVVVDEWRDQLKEASDLESLQAIWGNVPATVKPHLKTDIAEMTKQFESVNTDEK